MMMTNTKDCAFARSVGKKTFSHLMRNVTTTAPIVEPRWKEGKAMHDTVIAVVVAIVLIFLLWWIKEMYDNA